MAEDDLTIRAAIRDELSGPLAGIREELKRTGREAEQTGRKAAASSGGWDKLTRGIGGLARTAGRMAVYGVGGLTVALGAAAGAAGVLGVKTAASMQNAKVAFTTMLGSAKRANAFLRDLAKFAASTPFEFPELQTAASSLISAGIEADKVIPIMTSLGNATSGMGTGAEGVKRATVALQQMNAAGRITGEDLNQLRDAGIPVFDLLAAATGKSKKEVAGLAQQGKLGAKELAQLMKALETGKGLERFNGLMQKQSKTLGGVWSTLKDTVTMGLAKSLAPVVPLLTRLTLKGSDLAGVLLGKFNKGLRAGIRLGRELSGAFHADGLAGVGNVIEEHFGPDARRLFDKLAQAGKDLGTIVTSILVPAFGDAKAIAGPLASPLGLVADALHFAAKHGKQLEPVIAALVAGFGAYKAATIAANTVQGIAAVVSKLYAAGLVETEAATGGATVAQWSLNAALLANPIGLVIAAIALLVGGFVLAYKKIDWFRKGVQFAWKAIEAAAIFMWNHVYEPVFKLLVKGIAWIMDKFGDMLDAMSHVPGFGWAKGAADLMHGAAGKARELADNLGKIDTKPKVIHIDLAPPSDAQVAKVQSQLDRATRGRAGVVGDTRHSHAHGRGNLASTLATHAATIAATGARPTITNALIGGGGRGHGSGDHQAGRALDLQGKGLAKYGAHIRALGGFAAFHGSGSSRHLHAVPPAAGDTSTSMARRVRSRSSAGGAAGGVVIAAGAVRVEVNNPAANVDVAQAVADGIREYVRDREERA